MQPSMQRLLSDEYEDFDSPMRKGSKESSTGFERATKALRSMLTGRRFVAIVFVLSAGAMVTKNVPATFSKLGRFGVDQTSLVQGSGFLSYDMHVISRPKLLLSSFVSMMPSAQIDQLVVGILNVSSQHVTISPVLYDAEGYFVRSGPEQAVSKSVIDGSSGGVSWLSLPLDEGWTTRKGNAGSMQSFFLGVILRRAGGHHFEHGETFDGDYHEHEDYDCDAEYDKWRTSWSSTKQRWCCNHRNRACEAFGTATISLSMGLHELYEHTLKLDTHFAVHMSSYATTPGGVPLRRIDFDRWETLRRQFLRKDHSFQDPDWGSGFLAIQARWSVARPTWQATAVVGSTIVAIILMTDGVPAFAAFAALLVEFLCLGILEVKQAVSGFAQEGILTVAVFIVVARALDDISYVEESIMRFMGNPSSLRKAQLNVMLIACAMSAVIPNTAIIAMMMPILNRWAMRLGISSQQLHMPVAFASLLGSNLTLIGSGANLIAASIFTRVHIGMFDLFPMGVIISIVGIAYMVAVAPLLLPNKVSCDDEASTAEKSIEERLKNFRNRHSSEVMDHGEMIAAQENTMPEEQSLQSRLSAWEAPAAYRLNIAMPGGCNRFPVPTLSVMRDGAEEREGVRQRSSRSKDASKMRSASVGSMRQLAAAEAGKMQAVSGTCPDFATLRRSDHDSSFGSEVAQFAPIEEPLSREPVQARGKQELMRRAQARQYMVKFVVDKDGSLCGSDLRASGIQRVEGANLIEVLDSKGKCIFPKGRKVVLRGGECMRLRVTPHGYHNVRSFRGLVQPYGISAWLKQLGAGRRKRLLVEAVVQDVSSPLFSGCGKLDSRSFLEELRAVIVGVRRGAGAESGSSDDIALTGADSWDDIDIRSGDVLLMDARDLGRSIKERDEFLLVRRIDHTNPPRAGGVGDRFRAWLGISLLLGLLVLTSIPSLQVNTLVGAWFVAVLYVLFDLLSFEQVLQTLSLRMAALLTLMTAIGVGEAFHQSGVVDLLSGVIIEVATALGRAFGNQGAGLKVTVFFVVCNFAAFVNMGSSVAIMAPVVQQLVVDMPGVELRPIAFILMFAANSPFATPFGASVSLMVIEAGNYSFMDFFRFGLPLQILIMITVVCMSFVLYPDTPVAV